MNNLFFCHVGEPGSKRDFPRSLARQFHSAELLPYFEQDLGKTKAQLLKTALDRAYPNGFQCWGVPIGAESMFNSLTPGDVVLLIGKIQVEPFPDGEFEYAGVAGLKSTLPLHVTSRFVWTEARFPWMFFLVAEPVQLPWPIFLRDVGYANNFNPHGWALRVHPKRYRTLPGGDARSYYDHIVRNYRR